MIGNDKYIQAKEYGKTLIDNRDKSIKNYVLILLNQEKLLTLSQLNTSLTDSY